MTSSADKFDVAVIGGGPAGAAAALRLAERQVGVVLLEAKPLPRYKACGGGVHGRAAALLPESLKVEWERRCHAAELFLAGTDMRFEVRREQPLLSMVTRSNLDLALLTAATEAGAKLWSPCRLIGLHHRGARVELVTTNGPLAVEYVVVADGALGPTAALAGWREPFVGVPALEWQLEVEPEHLERFARAPRFDVAAVPHGYGWVFPKRTHLSVGVVSMRRSTRQLAHRLQAYIDGLGLGRPVVGERHGSVIPRRPRADGLVKGRVLLAGDAAGLADPLSGEGIGHAIASGRLAGAAIEEGGLDPWHVQYRYESSLEPMLGELRAGRWLAGVMFGAPRLRTWFFERFGQEFCEAIADVSSGSRTYREVLRQRRNYFKLVMQKPRYTTGALRTAAPGPAAAQQESEPGPDAPDVAVENRDANPSR